MSATGILTAIVVILVLLAGGSAYSAYRAEVSHPAAGQFVDVNGLSIHYVDTAKQNDSPQKPTIVLLHGASTSLLDFKPSLQPKLSGQYRVIAIDRPGMGYSDTHGRWMTPLEQAEVVLAALSALDINNAIWVGHSWAGAVVLAAMQDYPEQVDGGVLLAGATHPWEGGVKLDSRLANMPVIGTLLARLIVPLAGRLIVEDAVKGVFEPEPVTPGYLEETGVRLSIRPNTFLNNAADLYHLSDWLETRYQGYSEITPPLLMLSGDADEVVPAWNHAKRVAAQLPQAQWISLEGAGHALHHTRTDTVISHINAFVQSLTRHNNEP